MPLLPDQLDDFVNLTLDNFKKRKWIDLSLDNQHHVFASKFMKGKGSDPEKGGVQLNWKVQTSNTGTAKFSELYAVDTTKVKDLTTEAKQPWTKATVNFSYDTDEDVFQSDRETIIREVEVREHSMYNDFFELMEEALWTAPSSDTESPRSPSGVPFWIQKSATTPGFNLPPDGHPVLVSKIRKACEFTYFQAPKQFAELGGGRADSDWAFFTTYNVQEELEKLLESRNDNLGADLAKYAGSVLIKGNPVVWVPYLQNNDSSDPIYGVNFRVFKYFFRKGRKMLRHPPQKAARQHTVREVHMDTWGNFVCYNRRRNFVGYKA